MSAPVPLPASVPTSILVVDDDRGIGDLLAGYLAESGYLARVVRDGPQMWAQLSQAPVDLVVLDLGLPGTDGLTLCRQLRGQSALPVIMLTARGHADDRIIGLEYGADDYMAKPFDPRELLARIRSILRRSQGGGTGLSAQACPAQLRFAGWTLQLGIQALQAADGRVLSLGSSDFRMLHVLLQHSGQVLSRDFLAAQVYARDRMPSDRTIDMCISRLRQALEEDARQPRLIRTVRHQGYQFTVPVQRDE